MCRRATGSMDRPEQTPPTNHFGVESIMPWLHIEDDLPRLATEDDPDFQELGKKPG